MTGIGSRRNRSVLTLLVVVAIVLVSGSHLLDVWAVDWRTAGGPMLARPDWQFWLGTNALGQDLFARLVEAMVNATTMGFAVASSALLLGVLAGLVSGYWTDRWVDWCVLVLLGAVESIPIYFLVGAFALAFDGSFFWIGVSLALSFSVDIARVVRARIQEVRHAQFVLTALMLGVPKWRIVVIHLPSLVQPIAWTHFVISFVAAIKVDAVLGFLGLSSPDRLTFGTLLLDASGNLMAGHLYTIVPPVVVFFTMILALQYLAESLVDQASDRAMMHGA